MPVRALHRVHQQAASRAQDGITAFRRSSGEYLVFVEEDYKAKVLLYRWRP